MKTLLIILILTPILGHTIVGSNKFLNPTEHFVVGITHKNEIICTGILIDDKTVLTAAHCFNSSQHQEYFIYLGAGLENGLIPSNIEGELKALLSIKKHPHYSVYLSTGIDLAILKLQSAIKNFQYRVILSPVDDTTQLSLTVTGLGYSEESRGLKYSNNLMRQTSSQALILGGDGEDTCLYDSGAPAYVKKDNTIYLFGILSRGVEDSFLCGFGGVFTQIFFHKIWIHSHI